MTGIRKTMADKTETEVAVLKKEMQMVQIQNSKDHADIKAEICSVKGDVKSGFQSIALKLDGVIQEKADKLEVEEIRRKVDNVNREVAGLIIKVSLLMGVLIFIVQELIRKYMK